MKAEFLLFKEETKMKVWAVLWYAAYEGYSDDIRIFSTKDKTYDYLRKELERQYKALTVEDDTKQYYENKFQCLVNELNEEFDHDHDHIAFCIHDFTGLFEVQLTEIDKE